MSAALGQHPHRDSKREQRRGSESLLTGSDTLLLNFTQNAKAGDPPGFGYQLYLSITSCSPSHVSPFPCVGWGYNIHPHMAVMRVNFL